MISQKWSQQHWCPRVATSQIDSSPLLNWGKYNDHFFAISVIQKHFCIWTQYDKMKTDLLRVCVSESWKMEPTRGLRPLRRDADRKYNSRSLRLSNNNIKELHDLFRPINHFLSEPSLLSWLDLSFNQISHIHSVSRTNAVPSLTSDPWLVFAYSHLGPMLLVVQQILYHVDNIVPWPDTGV